MKEIYVLIAGANLAGKHETLTYIGKHAKKEFNVFRDESEKWRITHLFNEREYEMCFGLTRNLSRLFPKNIKDLSGNKEVKSEIEFMKKANGLMITIDGQREMINASLQHYSRLKDWLKQVNRSIDDIPIVFQINKKDIKEYTSDREIKRLFSSRMCCYVHTIATAGAGVMEAVSDLFKLIEDNNRKGRVDQVGADHRVIT